MSENLAALSNARRLEATDSLNRAADCYWAMQHVNTFAYRRIPGQDEKMFENRKAVLLMVQQMLDKEFHALMDQACNAWRVYRNPPKPKVETP